MKNYLFIVSIWTLCIDAMEQESIFNFKVHCKNNSESSITWNIKQENNVLHTDNIKQKEERPHNLTFTEKPFTLTFSSKDVISPRSNYLRFHKATICLSKNKETVTVSFGQKTYEYENIQQLACVISSKKKDNKYIFSLKIHPKTTLELPFNSPRTPRKNSPRNHSPRTNSPRGIKQLIKQKTVELVFEEIIKAQTIDT